MLSLLHPGDYELVVFQGRLHRAWRDMGHCLPRVLRILRKPVTDEYGVLDAMFWSLPRVTRQELEDK